jgi:hypothetical protein
MKTAVKKSLATTFAMLAALAVTGATGATAEAATGGSVHVHPNSCPGGTYQEVDDLGVTGYDSLGPAIGAYKLLLVLRDAQLHAEQDLDQGDQLGGWRFRQHQVGHRGH